MKKRKISVFNFITLNGFYKGIKGDYSWHKHGAEESKFSEEMLELGNILLFGRKTYENMFSFWPTEMASQLFPVVAKGMNNAEKIVFSNSLTDVEWKNTQVIGGDIAGKIRELKETPGKDMTVLGSGSIVSFLTRHNLIDEYQIMIDPVAIGEGVPLFKGITNQLDLELTRIKTFSSGTVLLNYKSV